MCLGTYTVIVIIIIQTKKILFSLRFFFKNTRILLNDKPVKEKRAKIKYNFKKTTKTKTIFYY